jgi:hypothetical protein
VIRQVPLFGIGNQAKSVNVNDQERLNLYVEVNDDPEKHVLTMYGTPGLLSFVNFGAFPSRGAREVGDFNYLVNRDKLHRIANDGSFVTLGTLDTNSGRVGLSDNGLQLIVVDGPNGYIYLLNAQVQTIASITRVTTTATLTTAAPHGLSSGMQVTVSGATPAQYNGLYTITVTGPTTFTYVMAGDPGSSAAPVGSYVVTSAFTRILDTDFPGADTVTFLNQRFIVNEPNSGRFFWSALLDGASWDALDFATAEASPDNIVSVFAEAGQLILLGQSVTEIWGDSGAADQAFVKVGGGAVEWGLEARWSLTKFIDSLAFLRKNRLGQVQACLMYGASAFPISNPQLEAEFTSYGDVSNAAGFAYMVNGHPFYQVNFPTVGKTWLYDGQSKSWSRLESSGGMHRVQFAVQLLGSIYGADFENGKLYKIEPDEYTDDGQPIAREFISRHQSVGDFTHIPELWIEMESGVGLQLGQGSDPQIMMQISRDGGHTWGNELWRSFGRVGQYLRRAVWRRLGRSRDWVFKFRITDPVKVVFVAAWGRVTK